MNVPFALQLGALIQDAYVGCYNNLANFDGQQYQGYNVIQTIYANDLATDLNPNIDPLVHVVPIGFVGRSATAPDDYVIVVRGTEGIWEWVQDAKILPIPFPCVAGAGLAEDGFTDMYLSLRVGPDPRSARLVPSLSGLLGGANCKLTICGHSLGSALVTLLAMDIAVNTPYKQPTLYTFASPRVGDLHFANYFNVTVPNCYRIANRMDLVTHVPTPPLYIHVGDETELNPGSNIANTLICMHDMATYLYMVSGAATALTPSCVKPAPVAAAPPQGILEVVVQDIEKI
jgi:triacylglycerol lipase